MPYIVPRLQYHQQERELGHLLYQDCVRTTPYFIIIIFIIIIIFLVLFLAIKWISTWQSGIHSWNNCKWWIINGY